MVTGKHVFWLVVALLLVSGCRAGANADEAPAPTPAPTTSATSAPPTAERVDTPLQPTVTEETMMATPTGPSGGTSGGEQSPQVEQAIADLAGRLEIAAGEIEVVTVEAVTWPDASLGCPQPGMAYAQVQQDGLLIRLQAGDRVYEYHSGGMRDPFLCEQVEVPPGEGRQKSTPVFGEDILTRPPSEEE